MKPLDLSAFPLLPVPVQNQTPSLTEAWCPIGPCMGKGYYYVTNAANYRFVVPCPCRNPQRQRNLLHLSGLPSRFFTATLVRPEGEPFALWGEEANQRTLRNAKAKGTRYLRHVRQNGNKPVPNFKGLLIYGPSGCGKTRLAASIAMDLRTWGCQTLTFVDAAKLLSRIAEAIQQGGGEAQVIAPLIDTALLILDNSQPPVSSPDRFLAKLAQIIEPRYEAGRPTLLTMTLSAWDLVPALGQFWASRYLDFCHSLHMPVGDFRLAHRKRPDHPTASPVHRREVPS